MGFFSFIYGIILLLLIFNLRSRVRNLEVLTHKKTSIENSTFDLKTLATENRSSNSDRLTQTETYGEALDSLISYIKEQIRLDISQEEIEKQLITNGWEISQVQKAFHFIIETSIEPTQLSTKNSQQEPALTDKLTEWIKEDWLLKLGAILLLIGFGWLTTYAFLNNWIGPMGRITLGVLAGTVFLLLGWWRMKKYVHQGGIFLVLGSTTILITIFAAREMYDFFTPFTALTVMFLSTAFVALSSVKHNNRPLALISLILAGVAPLLTDASTPDYIGLYSYLLVVILGAVWIVFLTGNRKLTTAALIIVALYSLPTLFSFPSTEQATLLIFAYAFTIVFFLTNTIGILHLKDKNIAPDLLTATGNGLLLLLWIMAAAQEEWKSLIIIAWMIIFILGAFLIFILTKKREPFFVYTGIAVTMLAAATALELNGAALTIAYTVQITMITLVAYAIFKNLKTAEKVSLLFIGPILLSINHITSHTWTTGVIHKDFFVIYILSILLLGLGAFFATQPKTETDQNSGSVQLYSKLLIIGSAYAYILLWISLHAGLENSSTAVMLSLIIYVVIGLITYFYGLAKDKTGLNYYGGVLVGLVVIRLLLIDIWIMPLAGKITTFFIIGALLISTAFLSKKNKNKQTKEISNNLPQL